MSEDPKQDRTPYTAPRSCSFSAHEKPIAERVPGIVLANVDVCANATGLSAS